MRRNQFCAIAPKKKSLDKRRINSESIKLLCPTSRQSCHWFKYRTVKILFLLSKMRKQIEHANWITAPEILIFIFFSLISNKLCNKIIEIVKENYEMIDGDRFCTITIADVG